ncbi:MAG: RsmB/NOP family class I SAM-dependent RNA methyltransferase [Pseudomonadota bacterium]
MTPAARVQAAIEALDLILAGAAAEQTLTRWARGARHAGSGDRAAVRDLVYQAIRCRASYASLGGAQTGRGLMLGHLRATGQVPDEVFSGATYAPEPLSAQERAAGAPPDEEARRDLPGWLWPLFVTSLGQDGAAAAVGALKRRAPVTVRVHAGKNTVPEMCRSLAGDGIEAVPVQDIPGALHLGKGARRLAQSQAYRDGAVELQDAHSQAAMLRLDVSAGTRVLDYCAGGGGKSLALAARGAGRVFAHDAAPRRMADLPERAARAGACVDRLDGAEVRRQAPYDLVLCDVPCSGSGTWRRTPEAKWSFTQTRLAELTACQDAILARAAGLVAPGGDLAYTTCSVLHDENDARVATFLDAGPDWQLTARQQWPVNETGDGFFLATFRRTGDADPARSVETTRKE